MLYKTGTLILGQKKAAVLELNQGKSAHLRSLVPALLVQLLLLRLLTAHVLRCRRVGSRQLPRRPVVCRHFRAGDSNVSELWKTLS